MKTYLLMIVGALFAGGLLRLLVELLPWWAWVILAVLMLGVIILAAALFLVGRGIAFWFYGPDPVEEAINS